jgi:Fur family ferric uptake transcriptional regulator
MQHNTLRAILKDNGSSLTIPRRIVFDNLYGQDPQNMQSLVKKSGGVLDRATVYRTIKLFEKLGIVHRINTGFKYKLELSDIFSGHHHHLHCSNCGRIIDFPSNPMMETMIDTLATKANFAQRSHSLDIYGLCSKCKNLKTN